MTILYSAVALNLVSIYQRMHCIILQQSGDYYECLSFFIAYLNRTGINYSMDGN